jgi:hypothetical protein
VPIFFLPHDIIELNSEIHFLNTLLKTSVTSVA